LKLCHRGLSENLYKYYTSQDRGEASADWVGG
jgi:hypothetical protein